VPHGKQMSLLRVGLVLGTFAALTEGCRPEVPPRYVEHMTLAEDASSRGDHAEAARQWQLASQFADMDHVRDEAFYRQATNLERASQHEASVGILRTLAATPGSRQERAAYDLATQALLAEPGDKGRQLEWTLVRFPRSGVARGALDRWLRPLTPAERLTILNRLAPKINEPTLSERMLLHQARNLELLGQLSEALRQYTALIHKYPYPAGQHWDEALLHKAALHARMGDRKTAVETLRGMLSYREYASVAGTYERRYAVATLMLAQMTAEHDWEAAHALLRDFPRTNPTSRELDDALWAAALLARDNAKPALACADLEALREANANSRYVACATLVCPDPLPVPNAPCRDYVARNRSDFDTVIFRAAAPYSGVNEQHGAFEREQHPVPPER
jgi:hypothetical protein